MGVQGPGLATGRVRLCSQQSFLDDSFEGPSQRLILSDAYIWKQAQTWSGRRFGQPKGAGTESARAVDAMLPYKAELEQRRCRRWCGSGDDA